MGSYLDRVKEMRSGAQEKSEKFFTDNHTGGPDLGKLPKMFDGVHREMSDIIHGPNSYLYPGGGPDLGVKGSLPHKAMQFMGKAAGRGLDAIDRAGVAGIHALDRGADAISRTAGEGFDAIRRKRESQKDYLYGTGPDVTGRSRDLGNLPSKDALTDVNLPTWTPDTRFGTEVKREVGKFGREMGAAIVKTPEALISGIGPMDTMEAAGTSTAQERANFLKRLEQAGVGDRPAYAMTDDTSGIFKKASPDLDRTLGIADRKAKDPDKDVTRDRKIAGLPDKPSTVEAIRGTDVDKKGPVDMDAVHKKHGIVEMIRGTTKSYYNPNVDEEFKTVREAIAGVHKKPTDEEYKFKREKLAQDKRQNLMKEKRLSKAANKTTYRDMKMGVDEEGNDIVVTHIIEPGEEPRPIGSGDAHKLRKRVGAVKGDPKAMLKLAKELKYDTPDALVAEAFKKSSPEEKNAWVEILETLPDKRISDAKKDRAESVVDKEPKKKPEVVDVWDGL
jgi:hypothetical protein